MKKTVKNELREKSVDDHDDGPIRVYVNSRE